MDIKGLIGTIIKTALPGGLVPTIVSKLAPVVIERIAGDAISVPGKPTYQEILHNPKIQDVVAPILGAFARKALPDEDEKAVGRLLKKIGDDIDG